MASESSGFEGFGEVSRWRGTAFHALLAASALVGIVALLVLLVYVSYQAFNLETASGTWFLVYGLTLALPTAAVGHWLRGRPAGLAVGVESATALWGGTMLAAGAGIFFVAVNPVTWFATVVPVAAVVGVVYALRRFAGVSSMVRVVVAAVLLGLGLFGIPGVVPSVALVLGRLPTLPSDYVILTLSLVVPAGLAVGAYVAGVRESRREGAIAGAVTVAAVAGLGYGIGLATGFAPGDGVLIPLFTLVPAGLHAWRTIENDDRSAAGLSLPVTVAAGALVGTLIADAVGATGPDSWLDWQFLTSLPATFPEVTGVFPSIVGSLLLMIVVVVLAFPVGVGAAVYLEEYAADNRLTRFIQVNISNLAGVPSVVYGLLGLAIFINTFHLETGSVIVGGMALGLLILPIVIISAQEAIRSVPESAREASYGMGATRWQTIRRVVLPQAMPGILTGTILALGRAIGETAPLIMIAAPNFYLGVPDGFFAPAAALPLQIYHMAFLPSDAFRQGVVPAGVVTMLIVLLTMNGVAIVLRNRFQNGD